MVPSMIASTLSAVDEIRLQLFHFESIIQFHFHPSFTILNTIKEGALRSKIGVD